MAERYCSANFKSGEELDRALLAAMNAERNAERAETAREAAETAADGAETAKTDAENALAGATVEKEAAERAKVDAQAAQAAAEQARDEAQEIAGGDFATPEYVNSQIAKSTLKIHRMNRYCTGAGWYRIGRFTMGAKNNMFPAGSPYSEIVRIYIHGNYNNGAPWPFVIDAYLMWNSGGVLRQQPAYHDPYAVTQVRICNVSGSYLDYDIDVYYPHSVGNDVHIAVEPLGSTFVSSGLLPVAEETGSAVQTLTLTKDGFLGAITAEYVGALPNNAPVPIEKGGTNAASVADARANLDVPSNADLTDAYNEILSRGEQLVVNGSGMLGDNTCFSRFTFDGNVTNKSQGSFKYNRAAYEIYTGDQFIPINIGKNILCELDIKSQNGLATWASFLDFYDVDKKQINQTNYNHVNASLTTLTQDLNDGDTVVHFADLSGWDANAPDAIDGFIFWGYTNSFGKVYPAKTYSQNVWSMLFNAAGVDVANNTITLKAPWNHGTFKAGTEVSQCIRNGGYQYFLTNQTIPAEWLHAKGVYGSGHIFAYPEAAYAKIGFLCNSNRASDTVWFTNVSIKEYVDTPTVDEMNAAISAAIGTALEASY